MNRRIYMIGDSIMQTNHYATYPQTGWGQVLSLFVTPDVEVINLAKNGTSSRSFNDLGLFKRVEDEISENDLLIIGFGHNDEKIQDPNRYTDPFSSFQDYLRKYIECAKSRKAHVILTTPVVRRKFENGEIVNTHGIYVSAIKEAAKSENIPVVDLYTKTKEFYEALGEEESKKYFMNFPPKTYENYPLGSSDDSHQRYAGAIEIAKFFVEEIFKQDYEVKNMFSPLPTPISCASDTYEK